jgi:hypothetical protein
MSLKDDVVKTFGNDIMLSGNAIVDKKSVIIRYGFEWRNTGR